MYIEYAHRQSCGNITFSAKLSNSWKYRERFAGKAGRLLLKESVEMAVVHCYELPMSLIKSPYLPLA